MSTTALLQTHAAKPQSTSHSAHAGLLLQRKCACGSPTSSLTGECAECKSKKRLQTKLTIGASNDPLEQEADRIAHQVLATPAHSSVSVAPPRIQRYTGQASGETGTAPASVDRVLAGSGRHLEPALQQNMEQRFGHDFSRVRVHSGAAAEQSAREVSANAYTVGHNIVFGAGRFAPGTHEGRRLLAHELTHVVQQAGSPMKVQRQAHTFIFISRGSYGETTPNITRPSCAAGAGTTTLVAGSAAPTVAVFPNGTYRVRRNDGVVQTATCTRLAAGLAATQAHEDHHVAGINAGVAAANTAGGLPQNFATAAPCTAALPSVLAPWNTSIAAVLANEAAHGPGTNPPTAQTFPQEHAAGTCAFV